MIPPLLLPFFITIYFYLNWSWFIPDTAITSPEFLFSFLFFYSPFSSTTFLALFFACFNLFLHVFTTPFYYPFLQLTFDVFAITDIISCSFLCLFFCCVFSCPRSFNHPTPFFPSSISGDLFPFNHFCLKGLFFFLSYLLFFFFSLTIFAKRFSISPPISINLYYWSFFRFVGCFESFFFNFPVCHYWVFNFFTIFWTDLLSDKVSFYYHYFFIKTLLIHWSYLGFLIFALSIFFISFFSLLFYTFLWPFKNRTSFVVNVESNQKRKKKKWRSSQIIAEINLFNPHLFLSFLFQTKIKKTKKNTKKNIYIMKQKEKIINKTTFR